MVKGVNQPQNNNPVSSIVKGALIGIGTSTAFNIGVGAYEIKSIKDKTPDKDVYIKQFLAREKELSEVVGIDFPEVEMMERAKSQYANIENAMKSSVSDVKKAMPRAIVKGTFIFGALGAGVAAAFHYVKNRNKKPV